MAVSANTATATEVITIDFRTRLFFLKRRFPVCKEVRIYYKIKILSLAITASTHVENASKGSDVPFLVNNYTLIFVIEASGAYISPLKSMILL